MSKKNKVFKSVDTISKELDAVDNFVLKYWKKYVLIAVIILVSISVFLVFSKRNSINGTTASNEILAASTVQQINDVIKKYPHSPLIQYKKLKLASILTDAKDYSGAISIYNQLISSNSDNYPMSVARLNLAYIMELQGKPDKAAKLFVQISHDNSISINIRSEAEYSAGRIYLALGNKDMALKYLEMCANVEKNVCLGWPEMAQSLLNRIN